MGMAKSSWHGYTKDKTIRKQKSIYYGFKYNYTLEDLKDYDYIKCNDTDVVKEILDQKVVALYQGQSEQGPRALGNRSIIFDPRNKDGKDIVNKIKKREWFRPFAGTILKEYANEYFDIDESPFMMYAVDVKSKELPCITHVDNTCRVQTLDEEINPVFYNMIKEFHKETGVPVLLNTSFNVDGDPIVETLEDAIETFNKSALDVLYLPDLGVMLKK
jgi:carbamoyltransferase